MNFNDKTNLLAFDFGASSGRATVGELSCDRLTLTEIHRFSNNPVIFNKALNWDILRLSHEVKNGLLGCKKKNIKVHSIGVDTWGVDFGLLDKNGELLGNPYHYRDERTNGMMEEAFKIIPNKELFMKTGNQSDFYNTIYQLLAMVKNNDTRLNNAETLLLMPDLINYMLTGKKVTEYTEATTTQLYNHIENDWNYEVIERLGIKKSMFGKIIKPGEVIGNLKDSLCEELGIQSVPVIAVGSHDTASAAVAVPLCDENSLFLSSGTWTLLGKELNKPLLSDEVCELGFTNEGGIDKVLFLKNIMGLWIIQECKRAWENEGLALSYGNLIEKASKAEEGKLFIDVDDELFKAPGNMHKKVQKFCERTNQAIPQTVGEIVRCVEESLAYKFKLSIEGIEKITYSQINTINVVGGGSQDRLLCSLISKVSGKRVVAGPVEATTIGNLIVQGIAIGKIKDIEHGRTIVRNSFNVEEFNAKKSEKLDKTYLKFLNYVEQKIK